MGVYPETQVLRIARQDYSNGLCSPQSTNTTLDPLILDLAPGYINFTLVYGGPPNGIMNIPGKFSCSIDGIAFKDGCIIPGAHGPALIVSAVLWSQSLRHVLHILATVQTVWRRSCRKGLKSGLMWMIQLVETACAQRESAGTIPLWIGQRATVPITPRGLRTCSPSSCRSQSTVQGSRYAEQFSLSL